MIKSDPSLLFLSKAISSKSDGMSAIDRKQFDLPPGEHHLKGVVSYDIVATVGEDTTANRSYGVPADSILDLASQLCGALRPHLHKAAAVVTELTRAKLEGRPIRSADYEYGGETHTIGVRAMRGMAAKLADREGRQNLSGSVKVKRPYAGAIKIVEAEVCTECVEVG